MKKALFPGFFLLYFVWCKSGSSAYAQNQRQEVSPKTIDNLVKAIDKDRGNLGLHNAYLKASGYTNWGTKEDPAFINNYKGWMKKYPNSAVLAYVPGHAYTGKGSPKAKPYLLKAIQLNPQMDLAYFDLWIDAERWGEFDKGQQYIGKASEIKPDDPNCSFYYGSGFGKSDPEKYQEMSLGVANRFPESERGAQALYWLAARSNSVNAKENYYELSEEKYSPAKYSWSSSGMSGYYSALLMPEQNDYVIPFLKSSGYTFIPLADYEGRDKGNLNNGGAAPVNYLIDQKENVVFRNFRTDGSNEDVLENMISSMIDWP